MLDILIKNALIYDGTGAEGFIGSVGVKDGRIALVSPGAANADAAEIIDGTGCILTPGFIDTHNHADRNLGIYPEATNFIAQGITTCVGGNCGSSIAPLTDGAYRDQVYKQRMLDLMDEWHTFKEYLDVFAATPSAVNFVPLVGHNALRGCAMGLDYDRAATDAEIEQEKALLREALAAGAFGMTTGTDPGMEGHCAERKEFVALFKVLEESGSYVSAHTRHHQYQWPSDNGRPYYGVFADYPGELLCGRYHGLNEFVEWLREAPGLRATISHLTSAFPVSQPHSLKMEEALVEETLRQIVDEPRAEGLKLWFNCIPNDNSIGAAFKVTRDLPRSMTMDPFFKNYAEIPVLLEALKDAGFRAKFKPFINSGKFKFGMVCPGADPYWAEEFTFLKAKDGSLVGKTLMETARSRFGSSNRTKLIYDAVYETLFDILADDPDVMWAQTLDRREYLGVEALLTHPCGMPCTDIISFPADPEDAVDNMGYGKPPACYTMFTRYLIRMVKGGRLPLREAIRRLTSLPAEVMTIEERGVVRTGYYADLNLINMDQLGYEEDYFHPGKRPSGMAAVLVNGQIVLRDSMPTGVRSGVVLRKQY